MNKYKKRADHTVIAVQLDLDTDGFVYQKWGGAQQCKSKDWIVNNNGETYTVDRIVFKKTYQAVSPGLYVKITPVWAEVAQSAGAIQTKEGQSHYEPGDYLVYNNEDGRDGYCISAKRFEAMYELVE